MSSLPKRTMIVSLLAIIPAITGLPGVTFAQTRDYRVGPRDMLQIRVAQEPAMDVDRRVSADGTVSLPLIGSLEVTGFTAAEIAAAIKEQLEKSYLQRATVTVDVSEIRASPIRVLGAVVQPGDLQVSGRLTLLDALSEAGGITGSPLGIISIVRQADNGLSDELEVPIDELLSNDQRLWNVPVFGNDLINVPTESTITIYFVGELATKGALDLSRSTGATFLTAIARAGGLTDRASKKLMIKRRMDDGTTEEIFVNYKRILRGQDPDIELQDGDLIAASRAAF